MATATHVSAAQLEANRRNAQKSSGPKSEEGKSIASRNSTRHGLSGRVDPQRPEDRHAYAEGVKRLIADWKPLGEQEEQLIQLIHDSGWQLNRLRAMEEKLWQEAEDGPPEAPEASGPSRGKLSLDSVTRYQRHHSGMYFRAIGHLVKLQSIRRKAELTDLECKVQDHLNQPYSRQKHGVLPPLDGFVLSASLYYQYFNRVALESQAEIDAFTAAPESAARGFSDYPS